jgi:hypothetical protein
MRACPSAVTIAVALMRLAFQSITFTLVLNKWPRSWTQWKRHGWVGFSISIPFSVSLPVSLPFPFPLPVPLAVSQYRVGRKGSRWSRSSG